MKRIFFITGILFLITHNSYTSEPTDDFGFLSARIFESGSNTLTYCRAWIAKGNEHYFNPIASTGTPYHKDRSFSCNGEFLIRLPVGSCILHVEKGKEYLPQDKEIEILQGDTTHIQVDLKRWINMVQLGWYSMDMHCHFGSDSLAILKETALADDINLQPVLSQWNKMRFKTAAYAWEGKSMDPFAYADSLHLITFRNEEMERIGGSAFISVGALHMFGISDTVQASSHIFPPDAMLAEKVKSQSPGCIIDMDKPNWGENVVGAALGIYNSAQLCHNHYHRSTNMRLCCGMAELPIVDDWKGNLFDLTNDIYYHYLNCGFKLAATGGSAMGVMRTPLGYNRTYAMLSGSLNEENYLEAIRKGRTFATSGPILFFSANEKMPGDTIFISTENNEIIRGTLELRSIEPIQTLNVIQNGEILNNTELDNDSIDTPFSKTVQFELKPERSGWIAAQALYRNKGNGQFRQAHSSPIYVLVDNKPIAFKKDAEIMIEWVDKLIDLNQTIREYQSDHEKETVLKLYNSARSIYSEISRTAENIWKD